MTTWPWPSLEYWHHLVSFWPLPWCKLWLPAHLVWRVWTLNGVLNSCNCYGYSVIKLQYYNSTGNHYLKSGRVLCWFYLRSKWLKCPTKISQKQTSVKRTHFVCEQILTGNTRIKECNFFCVCVAFVTICEQFVITVVSALTLNISQPETSKHLIDQEVFQRIHSGLNSLEKCCSPDSPTSARQRRSVRVRKGGISCNYYLLRLSRQFVGDKGRAAESRRPSYQANLIVSVALCNPELFRRQASSFKHTADGKY